MSGRFARRARNAAAVGGAALLVLALGAVEVARRGALDVWLSSAIAARLGPRVHFAAARAVWWPRLAVVLDNVALVPSAAAGAGAASAAAVTCRLRLAPLLRGRIAIATVRLDRPRVTVERGADGRVRAGGLEALAEPDSSGGAPGDMPAVQVHSGEVVYRGAAGAVPPVVRIAPIDGSLVPSGVGARLELGARLDGGGSLRVRGTIDELGNFDTARYSAAVDAVQLNAATVLAWIPASWWPPPAAGASAEGRLRLAATLSGRGRAALAGDVAIELFDGGATWTAWRAATPLRLTAHAAWDGTALALSQGQLDAARLSSPGLAAQTIAAPFAYADGILRVDQAVARAFGGRWRLSGRVARTDPLGIEGSLQADRVDGTELAAALSGLGVPGPLPRLDAPLHLTATGAGAAGGAWKGRVGIETEGAAAWSRARVDGPLQLAADVEVNGAAVALSNGRARARRVAGGGVTVDAVDADFAYGDGAVRVAPLRGTAWGGAWTYSGTLPITTATRWSGRLAGTQVSAAALRSALGARPDGSTTDGTLDLSAQLAGTGPSAFTGTATLQLGSTALIWDDLRLERPAQLSAAVRVQDARLALSNGQGRAQSVHIGELAASGVSAAFAYSGDTVHLASMKAHALGGSWHAAGAVALAPTPSWHGSIDAHHVEVGPLLRAGAGAEGDWPHSDGGVADFTAKLSQGGDGSTHGSTTVRLTSGTFAWGDLRVDGPAHGSGTFAVHGGQFTLSQAAAEATRAAYGPLVATAAAAHFHYAGRRLSFSDLRFHSCGGAWTHSGSILLASGGAFDGQLSIEGATPHDLATMLGEPSFDVAFARLDLDTEFQGHATPNWIGTLLAGGTIFLSDGTMRSTAVLRSIWEALVGAGRVMDALDRHTTRVQQLSDTYTLRRGRFHTTDLSLITDDYSATGIGSIGLDGSLDLEARIQLTAQGVQKMLVLESIPLPTSSLPSLPPIPTDVTGTLSNPVIRPNMAALPGSTARWLARVVLHTPHTVGGVILDGLGRLWGGAKRAAGAIGGAAAPADEQ